MVAALQDDTFTPLQDDMFTPDVIADPYGYYGRLRDEDPVQLERHLRVMGRHPA